MMPAQPELNVNVIKNGQIFTLCYNDKEWLSFVKPENETDERFENDLLIMMRGERIIDMDGADFEGLFEDRNVPHALDCRKIAFSELKKCKAYEDLMMELAGKKWVSVTFTGPNQITLYDFMVTLETLNKAYLNQEKLIDNGHAFELVEDESIDAAYIWVFCKHQSERER